MKRSFIAGLFLALIAMSSFASEADAVDAAKAETLAWLELTDSGEYRSSWESASSLFRAAVSNEDWEKALSAVRNPIGALKSREVATSTFSTTLPGVPDGEYVVFQFNSSFEHKASAVETVTAMKDTDGVWRVAGYFIK